MNARGAMRGRGRSASVPRDGASNKISIAELMKTQPCHGCGEYGHWIRQCPHMAKRMNAENYFSSAGMYQEDLMQFGQGGNVSQTVSPNQTVPQLPVAPRPKEGR